MVVGIKCAHAQRQSFTWQLNQCVARLCVLPPVVVQKWRHIPVPPAGQWIGLLNNTTVQVHDYNFCHSTERERQRLAGFPERLMWTMTSTWIFRLNVPQAVGSDSLALREDCAPAMLNPGICKPLLTVVSAGFRGEQALSGTVANLNTPQSEFDLRGVGQHIPTSSFTISQPQQGFLKTYQ